MSAQEGSDGILTPAVAKRTLGKYLMAYDLRDAELRAVVNEFLDKQGKDNKTR